MNRDKRVMTICALLPECSFADLETDDRSPSREHPLGAPQHGKLRSFRVDFHDTLGFVIGASESSYAIKKC
jgi:hypothetical protein